MVSVKIDGDDVELRCTPGAMRALCRKYGTLQSVEARIPALDFFVMADVVEAGIGAKMLKDLEIKREQLEDKIYESGLISMITPLTKFVAMLANGGKEIDAGGTDGDEAEGNG